MKKSNPIPWIILALTGAVIFVALIASFSQSRSPSPGWDRPPFPREHDR